MEAKTLPGRPKTNSLFRTATALWQRVFSDFSALWAMMANWLSNLLPAEPTCGRGAHGSPEAKPVHLLPVSSPSFKQSASKSSSSSKPFPSQETFCPPKPLPLNYPPRNHPLFPKFPDMPANYLCVTSPALLSRDLHSCVLPAYLQNCCADQDAAKHALERGTIVKIDLNCVIPAFVSCSFVIMMKLLIKISARCSQCEFNIEAISSLCWIFILQQLALSDPVHSLPSLPCCPSLKLLAEVLAGKHHHAGLALPTSPDVQISSPYLSLQLPSYLVQATQRSTSGHQMTVATSHGLQ